MKIDRAGVRLAEQIIFDLRRPKLGIHVRLVFAEQTTVLGFDSYDSIHSNQSTNRMATGLSQKDVPSPSSLPDGITRDTNHAGRRPRDDRLDSVDRGRLGSPSLPENDRADASSAQGNTSALQFYTS